jgi:hypothetical protein
MQHPSKFAPVLLGSVIMVLFAIVPLLNFINLACCAGIMLGGAAGAVYYNNQLKKIGESITFKDGAAIGILSGFIAAIIIVVFTTLLSMIMKENPIPEIYKIIDQQSFNLPPQAEQFLRKISDEYSKNGFSITLTLMSLVIDIIMYPVFGAIGGMLTVVILGKKKDVHGQ